MVIRNFGIIEDPWIRLDIFFLQYGILHTNFILDTTVQYSFMYKKTVGDLTLKASKRPQLYVPALVFFLVMALNLIKGD